MKDTAGQYFNRQTRWKQVFENVLSGQIGIDVSKVKLKFANSLLLQNLINIYSKRSFI